ERAQPPDAAAQACAGHRRETARARAAEKLEQQRLGLVVRVMREQHRGDAMLPREAVERRLARTSRCRLDADSRAALHLHALHMAGNAAGCAELAAELRP